MRAAPDDDPSCAFRALTGVPAWCSAWYARSDTEPEFLEMPCSTIEGKARSSMASRVARVRPALLVCVRGACVRVLKPAALLPIYFAR